MTPLQYFRQLIDERIANRSGPFKNLKIALVADELTTLCLQHECRVRSVSPSNYRTLFTSWRPDILLVESAWHGLGNRWKFRIASYANHPDRNNGDLVKVVNMARDQKIPSVFWNKEDGVHFDRFICSASLFDYIFTVDANAVPRYIANLGDSKPVHTLMFAVQPALHAPAVSDYQDSRACFVGSYSRHIHPRRRMWQEMLFEASKKLGLAVYDRNSARRSEVYRYPNYPWLDIRTRVPHRRTSCIYRNHRVCLNVNTVEDSPTMFSRRFLEILASGGLAVTTPALSIERQFGDFCHIVRNAEEATAVMDGLARGWRPIDNEMVRAGSEHVLKHHTWQARLEELLQIVPIGQ